MTAQVRVKETAFGRDMLEILMEKQLKQVDFRELDVPQSIVTLKAHLVNKFAPVQCEYPSELRFLYPTYFDSARVLIAEYVAEFFQAGMVIFSELDMERWEYIDHEIGVLILTEQDVDTLLRVLKRSRDLTMICVPDGSRKRIETAGWNISAMYKTL